MALEHKKKRTDAREFREILDELDYFQNEYARLTDMTEERIHEYASGARVVPGCDSILMRIMSILNSNPKILNQLTVQELAHHCSEMTLEEFHKKFKG